MTAAPEPLPTASSKCIASTASPSADYVPFYFTPWSPMLYNIQTGWGGVVQRSAEEIVFLVTSAARVEELGLSCLVTDSHAVIQTAQFFCMPDGLNEVDWELLRRRDFRRDPEDPKKLERYQAEALIHRRVPAEALLKLTCGTRDAEDRLKSQIRRAGIELDVAAQPDWYFQ